MQLQKNPPKYSTKSQSRSSILLTLSSMVKNQNILITSNTSILKSMQFKRNLCEFFPHIPMLALFTSMQLNFEKW